ncbi:DUF5060 domain-containing protein [Edaphobacter sp.]|uniref:DUF5060 domain-containing protein n=1 Tax=Edaphobacter sp. TaxID=1934404 RepID=UPI002DBC981F|nr:DUF5060 domain-containing protein [Edaphobacter sp.]HEU5342327.1 DUF5060 domain-containing protein [Edaphobacter sp.]
MHRRDLLKLGAATLATGLTPALAATATEPSSASVEQWGLFEITLPGPTTGNPYKEVVLTATFTLEHRTVHVTGFYDGDGTYRIRFMPDATGRWTYTTASSSPQLAGKSGAFTCTTPTTPGNHGPVIVRHEYHFQYADGTPYFPFGTTTYAYLFTSDDNARLALEGMKPHFNKTRACVLPKPLGGDKEQQILPFPRANGVNDLTRFNPAYFQLLEKRLLALQRANIQADVILFHPYDAWGYKSMPDEADDFYLRYAIARLSAFRNVWWSIANEYDLVKSKTMSDWDRFFRITVAEDPYSHLRSIHHSGPIYDNSKPWVTHASLQRYDFENTAERRLAWRKPIIYDEMQYEGDIDRRWGNLSGEEMLRRVWMAIVNGAYGSHGEVFFSATGEASSADAGQLRGDSPARIAFLHSLVEKLTTTGLNAPESPYYLNAGTPGQLYLYYFDYHRPSRYDFPLPTTANFRATLIDPWNMTTTPVPGTHSGKSRIQLPNKPYQAIVFEKISDNHNKNTEAAKPEVLD